MAVILGLDYGAQRIGVALSDAEQQHALAHGVVAAEPRTSTLEDLQRLCAAEGVERIVIGLPLTLEGAEGPQAVETRAFAEAVREATGLPVEFIDERFTSSDAAKAAAEKGTSPDAEAARLILDAWLQKQSPSR